VSSQKTVS